MTEEQGKLIEILSRAGVGQVKISQLLNVPKGTVSSFMQKHKLTGTQTDNTNTRYWKHKNAARDQDMVRLYLEGQTLQAIGTRFGVTRERVRQVLREQKCGKVKGGHGRLKPKGPKFKRTPTDRIWSKVDKTPGFGPNGDCWKWIGGKTGVDSAYGRIYFRGEYWSGRRIIFYLTHRRRSKVDMIGVTCKESLCVNPAHFIEGTIQEVFVASSSLYQRGQKAKEAKQNDLDRMASLQTDAAEDAGPLPGLPEALASKFDSPASDIQGSNQSQPHVPDSPV